MLQAGSKAEASTPFESDPEPSWRFHLSIHAIRNPDSFGMRKEIGVNNMAKKVGT
jgi:hypothetical protein